VSPAEVIERGLLAGTGPLHAWKSPNSPGFPWTMPGDCGVRWVSRKPATTTGFTSAESPPWPTPPGCSPRECSTPTAWSSWLARSATCCPAWPQAQTSFLSDVLGARIRGRTPRRGSRVGRTHGGPKPSHPQELMPVLERTTVYVWRRHLAAEAGRALLPATRRQRRQRRVHSYRPRPAPVPAPASACTAHLPAAPNSAPGAYRPRPMTGAAGAAVSIPRSWCRPSCRTRRGDGAALERMRLGQETT